MVTNTGEYDCLIFGGGLAGSVLAWTLIEEGKRPLLIGNTGKSRCSHVAAGLINPIGGKRLNLVWEAERHILYARNFYLRLQSKFDRQYYAERRIARIFSGDKEQKLWDAKKKIVAYKKWTSPLTKEDIPDACSTKELFGFAIKGAGIVKISELIGDVHEELAQRDAIENTDFDYQDIGFKNDRVTWRSSNAPIAVFTEGHLATDNPWFKFVPYRPAKGVIGRIKTNVQLSDTIIIQGKFLIPRQDGSAIVGATYNWEDMSDEPDRNGIAEIESFLRKLMGNHWSWLEIFAGVRPTIPGAMPAVGPHPEQRNLFSFNGFGSKGATQIPILADGLYRFIWEGKPLPKEILPARFKKEPNPLSKRWIAVEIARDRVMRHLKPGDTAIDATTGNGHDTLWLAQSVGPNGAVYAFDIQECAIDIARKKIDNLSIETQTTFLKACHSRMMSQLPLNIKAKAILFNLGYLPKGDKSIVTRIDTTISALDQSLTILHPNGIISIVIYPGHQGGTSEADGILNWTQSIDDSSYETEFVSNPSGNPKSPHLIFIQKRA